MAFSNQLLHATNRATVNATALEHITPRIGGSGEDKRRIRNPGLEIYRDVSNPGVEKYPRIKYLNIAKRTQMKVTLKICRISAEAAKILGL